MKLRALMLCAAVCASCGGGDDAAAPRSGDARTGTSAAMNVAPLSLATAEQLFNFAEYSYPQYAPGRKTTQSAAPFVYRHYPETGVYIGVVVGTDARYRMDGVYVLGGPFGGAVRYVGQVSDFVGPPDPYDPGYPGYGGGYPGAASRPETTR